MTCRLCGRPLVNKKCKRCFFIECDAFYAKGSIGRKVHCAEAKYDTYPDHCEVHGLTEYGVSNMKCLECFPESHSVKEARLIARKAKVRFYSAPCATHGPSLHFVRNGLCSICFNAMGAPRSPVTEPSARATARRMGLKTFTAVCDTHGDTDHYVANGLCSACFTSSGAWRTRDPDSARAAARRAHQTTYAAECEVHGPETPFHVMNGLCAFCFTTAGQPRKTGAMARVAADAALASGDSTFFWLCNKCGPGEFNARGRKCLRCDAVARD